MVWYIYLHEWLIFMVNLGKSTGPMDPMGYTRTVIRSQVGCFTYGILLPNYLGDSNKPFK